MVDTLLCVPVGETEAILAALAVETKPVRASTAPAICAHFIITALIKVYQGHVQGRWLTEIITEVRPCSDGRMSEITQGSATKMPLAKSTGTIPLLTPDCAVQEFQQRAESCLPETPGKRHRRWKYNPPYR